MMRQFRPRLTIAIPTLNRAPLLARALASSLAQTRDDIEILVSDNGSTDTTPQILTGYSDPRLRVLRRERTIPPAEHGNVLVSEARGDYFVGLSDDDFLEPEFAARVLNLLDRHSDIEFVYTGCMIHFGQIAVPSLAGPDLEPGVDFLRSFFSGNREVCWCACATRTTSLRAIGPIPPGRIFGDLFYWTKLACDGSVGCVPAKLSHYTFMTDNLSSATPITPWADEVRGIADEVLAQLARMSVDPAILHELRADCTAFVARSTANQFVWNSIRWRSRTAMVASLPAVMKYLAPRPFSLLRVAAALTLPRTVLLRLILLAARQRASMRSTAGQ
jgi:hypothetical protein